MKVYDKYNRIINKNKTKGTCTLPCVSQYWKIYHLNFTNTLLILFQDKYSKLPLAFLRGTDILKKYDAAFLKSNHNSGYL